MNKASSNSALRFWAILWFIVAVLVIPWLVIKILVDVFVIPWLVVRSWVDENQLTVTLSLAALDFCIWLLWQSLHHVDKGTAIIVKNKITDTRTTHQKGWYLIIPLLHKLVAVIPCYPLVLEFPVENIDTLTPRISRIKKIEVRATCAITQPDVFFKASLALMERTKRIEAEKKLKLRDLALWQQLFKEAFAVTITQKIRDIVWHWQDHLNQDPTLRKQLPFTVNWNAEMDPYELSLNRDNLVKQVASEMRLIGNTWGFTLNELTFKSIEIDSDLVFHRTRLFARELVIASHDAKRLGNAIREKGFAEAEVRAHTLGLLLEELLVTRRIPLNDPLIAKIVRAALYSDGETIWEGVIEKSDTGDGKTK